MGLGPVVSIGPVPEACTNPVAGLLDVAGAKGTPAARVVFLAENFAERGPAAVERL